MREFVTAAMKEGEDYRHEQDSITFTHDEREVTFFEPSSAQAALMASVRASREVGLREVQILMNFFFGLMDEQTSDYFEGRMMDPRDPLADLDAEGGMNDILDFLFEEWSGKAPKQPSDYQSSRKQTGRSSTGNTRGKASTSSTSRSRASSTSSKSGR